MSFDSSKQLQQMVNFIHLEAEEKAQELRLKTEQECEIKKQTIISKGRIRINEEFDRKEKDVAVQRRIAESKQEAGEMSRKFQAREQLLQSLHASVTAKLVKWPSQNKPAYAKLIHDLIVQGLSKLHDSEVMVVCRACDKQIVETAIGQIKGLADFSHCNITVHPTSSLSADSAGGVKLTTRGNKIVCDNTLEARLAHSMHDMQPAVRYLLFPSARAEPKGLQASLAAGQAEEGDLLGFGK